METPRSGHSRSQVARCSSERAECRERKLLAGRRRLGAACSACSATGVSGRALTPGCACIRPWWPMKRRCSRLRSRLIPNSCLRLLPHAGSRLGDAGVTIRCMVGEGHQAFVGELARFAATTADGRLTAIAAAGRGTAAGGRARASRRGLHHSGARVGPRRNRATRAGPSCLRHRRSGQARGLSRLFRPSRRAMSGAGGAQQSRCGRFRRGRADGARAGAL